jgi:hypothetical protein
VFEELDNHERLAGHMMESSVMMVRVRPVSRPSCRIEDHDGR